MDDAKGYIKNCILVARAGGGALFNTDGTPFLDGYAVIPSEVFLAMGGTDHPAYELCAKEAQLFHARAGAPTTLTPIEELQREVDELRSRISAIEPNS